MVVFTCGHCGESVQKPKVEKHYLTKCRNRNPNLSCMDCFKDFLGNDYESHTKCITEEERYSGKGYMAKEKKGEKKQNAWVEMVQSVLDEQKGAPKNVIRIIETISKHNNTPRKKPKFYNFVKNVCGAKTGAKDIEQAWDLLSVKLAALSTNSQQKDNDIEATNGKSEEGSDNDNERTDDQNGFEKEVPNGKVSEIPNGADPGEIEENGQQEATENGEKASDKTLTKKQRKEEKKRRKYEAELLSAEAPPAENGEEEEELTKKGKKKKNKSESSNGDVEEYHEDKNANKNKKRKRQDTANSVPEILENGHENEESIPVVPKERTVKKKLKVGEEDADESVCLHDQNVAKIEGLSMKAEKFNWHATIMSVLQKKGNEVPFKRLQKKVLGEYSEATGQEVDDRIADKFIKKLRSAPNVRVDKNRVLLLE